MAISKAKQDRLKETIKNLNKKVNKNSTAIGFVKDKADDLRLDFIQSPSHLFNAALAGGIARGRIAELYGESGSGE